MLDDLVTLTTRHLKRGQNPPERSQVRKRAARIGRNPATGEAIKPVTELKEAVLHDTASRPARFRCTVQLPDVRFDSRRKHGPVGFRQLSNWALWRGLS